MGLIALLIAALMAWYGWDLEAPFAYEPVGPRAFPLLLAAIIGLCGLWMLIRGGHEVEPNPPGTNPRIIMMLVIVAGYALTFEPLGFVISTSLLTLLVGLLFGGNWWKCAVGGVIMSVLFFLLFDHALDVVLPRGLLGDLL